ncbi:MAG: iron ABC transporter permease [Candidatus Reconcilbacillus cellulovorans]|uniref:Iron ABC transporter permease n=1 Tax=Candidatus Reconcilbacillus cellulovorans TaxID=1906605 RepID=A0A2A6E1Z6_9BACL|nr:MAG: iron ABC transporter permease [Candidatus Reconcilbacillus cellulovorans]
MRQRAIVRRQRILLVIMLGLIALTFVVGMGWGYASLSFDRLLPVLLGKGTAKEQFVLYSIRLPRLAVTLLAGMALALSGALLQGLMRNNLADPGIVGINAGAGVGVALYFLFFPAQADSFVYVLPLVAFFGACLTAALIYLFASRRGTGIQPIRLVLVGVGFSLALSGTMVVLITSADPFQVDFIARWLTGSVWGTDWPFVWALLPWLLVLVPVALLKTRSLDMLGLGDVAATGAGVPVERERLLLLLAAVGLAASAVAVTGGISFIGLMAPHIARALVGPRYGLMLPLAVLVGGWLLVAADIVGRNLADGIPAGIMVSLIGAPYFVYLLLKK